MPEELLERLRNLETSYYGDKEEARKKQFFDTYGGRFSNNRGLGLAILNELDARGIDTSAADEAVTEILDQLRTQCNEIIESIKEVQNTAIENAQKVEAIQNVVSEAVANNPDSTIGAQADMGGVPSVPEDETISAMDPADQEQLDLPEDFVPEEGEGEAEEEPPMPEEGEGEAAEEPEPPMPEAEPTEEPTLPPEQVESDMRMKRVKRMQAAWGKARGQTKKEGSKDKPKDKPKDKSEDKSNYWTPAANLIAAAHGGN